MAAAALLALSVSGIGASAALADHSDATPSRCVGSSIINSNFNGTAIPAGDTIWFNAVVKVSGIGSSPVTVDVNSMTITFSSGGTTYTVNVPNSKIIFNSTLSTATTTFNGGTWVTSLPPGGAGNTFLTGVAFPVPAGGLPGGINPVSWKANFTSDTKGVSFQWQWAAAVYTSFGAPADYTSLGVKPVDDGSLSSYKNADHAGTPENFEKFVVGGARGGGGSNFTGSYSDTASVSCPAPGTTTIIIPITE
jgi:hypothetical protein